MRHFYYKEGELFCEKLAVKEIAKEVGTPFYLYSYRSIVDNFDRIKKAFAPSHPLICYSLKANSNLTLCKILASYGAGADIVSGGELYQALQAGFPPEKIVYAGVGKTSQEIEYALKENILLFNVESENELKSIAEIASSVGKKAKVSLRVNLDIDPKTHHYITTGKKENKFGIFLSQAEKLYRKMLNMKSIEVKGIHTHIGSQITNIRPYLEAVKKLVQFIDKLKEYGINLSYLNMGGGFGISYRKEEKELSIESLSRSILPLIPRGIKLILEPGRYIVGPAGALITRLIYKKVGDRKKFFIVDAGMNDLIRVPLYQAYHEIIPVKESTASLVEADVVGPVCESADFFAEEKILPSIKEGDLLAILDTGAYGFSMSSNYNGRCKVAEVLVKDDRWWLIRERESFDNFLWGQRIPVSSYLYKNVSFLKRGLLKVDFWKMEGSGNDFVLIDNRGEIIKERGKFARKICQRKKGIGADGLILIEESEDADFTMRIFNPDGSEAEMCGNGARCAARFSFLKGISGKKCTFKTLAGKIEAEVNGNKVKVKMSNPSEFMKDVKLNIDNKEYKGHYINTGVPHFVLFCKDIDKVSVKELGYKIRFHKFFQSEGTNVDFAEIKDEKVFSRTYERGVEDETLGCGTGAVASALVSSILYEFSSPVIVKMKGGEVRIWFEKEGEGFKNIFLEGEANIVYKGHLNLKGGDYV